MAKLKEYYGKTLLEIEGGKIKEYYGKTLYEIDGDKVKEYYGKNIFEINIAERPCWNSTGKN